MRFIGATIDLNCSRRCSHGPVGRLPSVKTSADANRSQTGGYNIYEAHLDLRPNAGWIFARCRLALDAPFYLNRSVPARDDVTSLTGIGDANHGPAAFTTSF
jgi:hypothetical protein